MKQVIVKGCGILGILFSTPAIAQSYIHESTTLTIADKKYHVVGNAPCPSGVVSVIAPENGRCAKLERNKVQSLNLIQIGTHQPMTADIEATGAGSRLAVKVLSLWPSFPAMAAK